MGLRLVAMAALAALVLSLGGCASGPTEARTPAGLGDIASQGIALEATLAPVPLTFTVEGTSQGSMEVAGLAWWPDASTKTVVLGLHGVAGYKENNWGPQPVPGYSMAHRQVALGRSFVAIDLPGYGGSGGDRTIGAHSDLLLAVDQVADDLRAGTYIAQGTEPRAFPLVVGVGHSMGAWVLENTQSSFATFDAIVSMGFSHHGVSQEFRGCLLGEPVAGPCRDPYFHAPGMDPLVYQHMNETLGPAPATLSPVFLAWFHAQDPALNAAMLSRITCPVLLQFGAEDWIWADVTHDDDAFPAVDAALQIVPDAGHFNLHHRSHAQAFAGIEAWLSSAGV
ncbi:MAG TPA: alpha/beta fold hydrolase [Candidatus Thermoplasmatota archaeon]|nr:alpha/beta fold hydrolase [Candidatus Thermoplasmatota archaeon]